MRILPGSLQTGMGLDQLAVGRQTLFHTIPSLHVYKATRPLEASVICTCPLGGSSSPLSHLIAIIYNRNTF